MTHVYIIPLEPIENRYTYQWKNGVPAELALFCEEQDLDVGYSSIHGEHIQSNNGNAFLDFASTNIWKSTQIAEFSRLVMMGEVERGSKVLFTDAWHPGVHNVRYMSELLGLELEIYGMWHAGSYDPNDFLGRIENQAWSSSMEVALFLAYDVNVFATMYHRELFLETRFPDEATRHLMRTSCLLSGQPHLYLESVIADYQGDPKSRTIVFPHRVAPEKQHEIFLDLAQHMTDVEFVTCQDLKLTKKQYYKIMAESSVVFSANLQETLGIGVMEGTMLGALPFVPDRLSYSEMYEGQFLYPSEWTESWESYQKNKARVIERLYSLLNNRETYEESLKRQNARLRYYTNAGPMWDRMLIDI